MAGLIPFDRANCVHIALATSPFLLRKFGVEAPNPTITPRSYPSEQKSPSATTDESDKEDLGSKPLTSHQRSNSSYIFEVDKSFETLQPIPAPSPALERSRIEGSPGQYTQAQRALQLLKEKRRIVAVVGAGISVSAGIPDFRSSGGMFSVARGNKKQAVSGVDLFNAEVYREKSSTAAFHDMIRRLCELTEAAQPTEFHRLLAQIAHEGRLLRLYTQNIDCLDISLPTLGTQIPLPSKSPFPQTVQLHGSLRHMVCAYCATVLTLKRELFSGPDPPDCPKCEVEVKQRILAGKRGRGVGRLRPRIVLYGEANPDDEAIGACIQEDLTAKPDALLVAGTSLKVPGAKRLVREMCGVVHNQKDGQTIWINVDVEPTGPGFRKAWDISIRGTCDSIIPLQE